MEEGERFRQANLPRRIPDATQRTGHRLARPGEKVGLRVHYMSVARLLWALHACYGRTVPFFFFTVGTPIYEQPVANLKQALVTKAFHEPDQDPFETRGSCRVG